MQKIDSAESGIAEVGSWFTIDRIECDQSAVASGHMDGLARGAFVVRHTAVQIAVVGRTGVAVGFGIEMPKRAAASRFYSCYLAE